MTPGVNAPKLAGAPSVSDSVAATVPPAPPVGATVDVRSASETSKNTLPIASTLTRAPVAATFGHAPVYEPSLGVLATIVVEPAVEGDQADLDVGHVDRRDVGAARRPT